MDAESVTSAFTALVESLDSPSPEVRVLVAAGRALALEIDVAQLPDDKGATKSASSAVTSLRALTGDLIAKGRAVVADPDEAEDWSAPSAIADLAEVRDAKKPGARNARSRSVGGSKAAS